MSLFSIPIEENISHIEIASLNFDQWILTVSLREYASNNVKGMSLCVFTGVEGFRLLDEGQMLQYPWPDDTSRHYVVAVPDGGWLKQELSFGNAVSIDSAQEYLVATNNECLCVIAHDQPTFIQEASG